jgi:hypothetical protein
LVLKNRARLRKVLDKNLRFLTNLILDFCTDRTLAVSLREPGPSFEPATFVLEPC